MKLLNDEKKEAPKSPPPPSPLFSPVQVPDDYNDLIWKYLKPRRIYIANP